MKTYDLRTDTITKPSIEMRRAMYEAECGDDVYGEDPTVAELQRYAAELTKMESALYVSSGTMGNLIPLMLLGGKGKDVIVEKECHILHYELGGVSSLADFMPVSILAPRGILNKQMVAEHMQESTYYFISKVAMVAIENSHNRASGAVYPIDTLRELYKFVKSRSVHFHIDGARIFNAACASGVPVNVITENCDSVTFCLSKGLGAPVGAMLCGSKALIEEAMVIRKLIGGGLRQSGVIAAAGLYALKNNIKDIAKDHVHAKQIAVAMNNGGIAKIEPASVETNIVIGETEKPAKDIAGDLNKVGIKASVFGDYKLRMVTHRDISAADISEVCDILSNWNTHSSNTKTNFAKMGVNSKGYRI